MTSQPSPELEVEVLLRQASSSKFFSRRSLSTSSIINNSSSLIIIRKEREEEVPRIILKAIKTALEILQIKPTLTNVAMEEATTVEDNTNKEVDISRRITNSNKIMSPVPSQQVLTRDNLKTFLRCSLTWRICTPWKLLS
jgi:hypothetical protein